MIYLNYAATSPRKPPCVAEAMVRALEQGSSARGAGDSDLDAARTVYRARASLASLLGFSHPERVVFTANATQALNTAIFGLLRGGGRVLSTDWEHNSVLRPLYRVQRERGVALDFVPADPQGRLDPAAFERLLRPDTRAIVCTHASNLTGDMNDLAALGRLAAAHGIPLIVDAAQTAGCHPLDMEALGISVLCFTGHKGLMGPQGTGGLCVAPGVELEPLITGGTGVHSYDPAQPQAYPEHLEAGTLNGPGIAGLGAAAEFLRQVGVEAICEKEAALTRRFREGACSIPGVTVYGNFSAPHAPIVLVNLRGWTSDEAADELSRVYGIAVRAGAHCAPRLHRALGTQQTGAVRFSFGWYTTGEELDAALMALQRMAAE